MTTAGVPVGVEPGALRDAVAVRVLDGARFAALFASARTAGTRLSAVVAWPDRYELVESDMRGDQSRYPALTSRVPAAAWYERAIHDLFGIVPEGHPRLDPLVLPLQAGATRPRPGSAGGIPAVDPEESALAAHVTGEAVFTIPYGPVRSGVFESIEYLVETPGEDIPHLRTRVFQKHRGIEKRFEGLDIWDGALLAERVEGVASVAHAIAFCEAVEEVATARVDDRACMTRTLHAELERIANHLDVVVRLTEAAGLAVAHARFATHKERLLRLVARLCGHRFGRGVVVPGGVRALPNVDPSDALRDVERQEAAIRRDANLLLATPSFLDRVRATGVLAPEVAATLAAIGPVGRASGLVDDARITRPYAGYRHVGFERPKPRSAGDAQARLHVRLDEIWGAFHIVRQALDALDSLGPGPCRVDVSPATGCALGWAEAPQGEVLYLVELVDGKLRRVAPRSPSFHNLAVLPVVFDGDILTDFAFIEASFGLSIAGVAL